MNVRNVNSAIKKKDGLSLKLVLEIPLIPLHMKSNSPAEKCREGLTHTVSSCLQSDK